MAARAAPSTVAGACDMACNQEEGDPEAEPCCSPQNPYPVAHIRQKDFLSLGYLPQQHQQLARDTEFKL